MIHYQLQSRNTIKSQLFHAIFVILTVSTNLSLHQQQLTRAWKKGLKKAKTREDGVDGEINDNKESKRSVISNVLMVWGFVESFSLILVLLRMASNNNLKGYPHNFINDFCDPPYKCDAIILRIIFYKLLTSIALVIGVKYRWTIAMIPWLLVNVLGIFPYSLVATSALYDYNIVATDGYIGLSYLKELWKSCCVSEN